MFTVHPDISGLSESGDIPLEQLIVWPVDGYLY